MKTIVGILGAALCATAVSIIGQVPVAQADHIPYSAGEVFVGVIGEIKRFTPAGALIESLSTPGGLSEQSGMCFDAAANLRSTNYTLNSMPLYDNQGGVVQYPWGGPFAANPESCVVDSGGNVYVGQSDGSADVLKFDASGTLLDSFDVDLEFRGSDWIDVSGDTLLYTSEGLTVKAFDLVSETQLPDFSPDAGVDASGIGHICYGLGARANGEVLVACSDQVVRVDPAGNVLARYSALDYGVFGNVLFFALALDPDGTTFWTADYNSGEILRIGIESGVLHARFNAGKPVQGLAISPGDICTNPPSPTITGDADVNIVYAPATTVNHIVDIRDGSDVVVLGDGQDIILGGPGDDILLGGAGNDIICGGPGNDVILGGGGNDLIRGDDGADTILGEDGDDQIKGGMGDDVLDAGPGFNFIDGGGGTNDICLNGNTENCP